MNTAALLAATNNNQSGNPLGLIILLLPIGAIVFLMIMPQRKQRQKQAQVVNNLTVGDEVVTIGGVIGVINHIEDDVVHLEVDDDVVIRLSKGAISRPLGEPDPAVASKSRGLLARGPYARADSGGDASDDKGANEGDDEGDDDKEPTN